MSDQDQIRQLGLEPAPKALDDLIADAMIKYGPDGHCDGNEVIAALAWDWMKRNAPSLPKPQGDGE